MTDLPRILLAAPSSGTGKTTLTLALLAALQARGVRPLAFKCGPDYIDPMFHRAVLGVESHNLDLFLSDATVVNGLLASSKGGLAVLEGVMGYYDGVGGTEQASSFALARATETPVILVVSARGAALSLAATIHGFAHFRPESGIKGVLLNHCSPALYARLKPVLERETGLPLLGYFPRLPDCQIESRHLGLVTTAELTHLRELVVRLGKQAVESLDLEAILALSRTAPPLTGALPTRSPITVSRPRIAIAQDRAFCFYYPENLDLLTQLGAELVPFSPLRDRSLPPQTTGLYLGGGYPELYLDTLSQNTSLRDELRRAISGGLPTIAECGGFLYLHETLDGAPMVGAVAGHASATKSLQSFGYATLTARYNTLLTRTGETFPIHEFHYWKSDTPGDACRAEKADGRAWDCIVATQTLFAGFPHLYFYVNPDLAARFVKAAAQFGGY